MCTSLPQCSSGTMQCLLQLANNQTQVIYNRHADPRYRLANMLSLLYWICIYVCMYITRPAYLATQQNELYTASAFSRIILTQNNFLHRVDGTQSDILQNKDYLSMLHAFSRVSLSLSHFKEIENWKKKNKTLDVCKGRSDQSIRLAAYIHFFQI